ncbi:hypothetical protein [Paraburkholderia acidipaludis]|uniref:hypothetical protein n=1 Tax=Paraburkholderia acidipaludis TaxID=660537 RepID=UPI001FE069EB|nr:hypothetical protein [Paraburkholderia acidipaludis]
MPAAEAASHGSGVDVPTSADAAAFVCAAALVGATLEFATPATWDPDDESPLHADSTRAADNNRETSPTVLHVMIPSNKPALLYALITQDY